MMTLRRSVAGALSFALMSSVSVSIAAQTHITTPKEEFGANFGDDYFLANYKQIAAYWHKLDRESDRMVVQEIGKTAEGRPHLMAIVTQSCKAFPNACGRGEEIREDHHQSATGNTIRDLMHRAMQR